MSTEVTGDDVRDQMVNFWQEHSREASVKEMMLDTDADKISQQEGPEILDLLPDREGKDILELGAGIGRFTGILAQKAKTITAVDFMQKFIDKNRETNGHHPHVKFMCADVTKLDLPKKSFDLVFTNWLLMYLSDEEVRNLGTSLLSWLRDDGYLFFRESCFHQSGKFYYKWNLYETGNKDRQTNPSKYRSPAVYNNLFQSVSIPTEDGEGSYGFEIIVSKSIQAYIKLKSNHNQVCWLMHKVRRSDKGYHGFKTFQEFLDNQQYNRNGILRYERIFGKNFVSTGGKETTEEFVAMLDLKPGQQVLDVGSGIGGSAFYMAQTYDVKVIGIDLSDNMISIGLERLNEMEDPRVQFEVADATKRNYPAESFDVVYSRDTILHIPDKEALFKKFYTWLKPGGKLLISDYCCSDGEHSEAFKKYVAGRGYILLSPKNYGKVLEKVGFINVKAEDRTDQFVRVLTKELKTCDEVKEDFIKEFSEKDFNYIVDGWKDKVVRCGQGDQKWGLFYAEKPKA